VNTYIIGYFKNFNVQTFRKGTGKVIQEKITYFYFENFGCTVFSLANMGQTCLASACYLVPDPATGILLVYTRVWPGLEQRGPPPTTS
jgi:hypothetical protein